MPRYLVTGCAGFIGSHVTDTLLAGGHEVIGVDCFRGSHPRADQESNLTVARRSPSFDFREGDLADLPLAPLLEGVDGIFHLAAQTGVRAGGARDLDARVEQNLVTTERVFAAAAAAGIRVAFASSAAVYGEAPAHPTPEHTESSPISPHGQTNVACERLALLYAAEHGLDVVTLRYFTVYGPRQRPDMAIALIAAALRDGEPFAVFGDGAQTRDPTYIGDAVDATIAAFHRAARGAVFNVSGGHETTLGEIVELAGQIAGRPVPVAHRAAKPGEARRLCADTRRIRAELGWTPSVALAEGLAAQLESAGVGPLSTAIAPAERRRTLTRGAGLPLVTVVVPTFNGLPYLIESLDSIMAQTYPHMEVLVLDDASTDGTEQALAAYGDRIVYHRQGQTRGQFDNVNDGIALARGELIAVYHGDDVYEPEIVEREVAYLGRHPQVGAVFCKDTFIGADGVAFGQLELPAEIAGGKPLDYETVLSALLTHKNRFLRCPSSMVRATVYRDVGTYRGDMFEIASDLEMWLRIARHSPIGVIDEHLFSYRRGHGSSSDRYEQHRTQPERFFEILDVELGSGARELVSAATLAAYEAHRAEDQLKLTVSNYVLKRPKGSRAALSGVTARQILSSDQVQRTRLLVLLAVMHGLVRLPRIPSAAQLLDRRLFDHPAPQPVPGPSLTAP